MRCTLLPGSIKKKKKQYRKQVILFWISGRSGFSLREEKKSEPTDSLNLLLRKISKDAEEKGEIQKETSGLPELQTWSWKSERDQSNWSLWARVAEKCREGEF